MDELPTPDKLAKIFLKIRGAREELRQRYEQEDKKLESQLKEVEAMLIQVCNTNHVSSMRTEYGTIIRSVKTRYWTNNWPEMYSIIREYDCPELLEKRIAQNNLKQFLEEHEDLNIRDLHEDKKYSITVRKPKEI